MFQWLRRSGPAKVLVLGLDCVPPELIFDEFKTDLPALTELTHGGTWGTLQSSVPCITVPAWSSMLSSQDPGQLGFYGFRNRDGHTYNGLQVADGRAVQAKRVWDYTSAADKDNIIIGVPQTYPTRPLNGHLVSGFLTPGTGSAFTYPAIFKQEVLKHAPNYAFDAKGFRTDDKAWLRQEISDVTAVQFDLLKHALTSKPWDFAMFVNMGTDRIHHGFWRYHDPQHRLHDPSSPYRHTIREYYKQVDAHIADILNVIPDDTTVVVVSDHGAKRMDGAICINEWLWRNGWLVLNEAPPEGTLTRFEDISVSWEETRAWSTGGYYGRIFLNVNGREPTGPIPADAYEETRDELAAALQAIPAPDGTPLNTQTFKPEEIYHATNNTPPDLLVYFGDLHWRCAGTFGHNGVYTLDNDTGPDDANHSPEGMFILNAPNEHGRGHIADRQLMDIAPTLLQHLDIDTPAIMRGTPIE